MALRLIGLLAAAEALDCARYGLGNFDGTYIATTLHSTPPSRTNKTVYFNPCGPVKGPKECAKDDHFCAVEWTEMGRKWQLTQVIPIGSEDANATEHVWLSNEGGDENNSGSTMDIRYEGAKWGDETQSGLISFFCGPELTIELNPESEGDFFWPAVNWYVKVKTPTFCEDGEPSDPGDSEPPEKRGGWGFFTWLFVLLLIGLIGYAALTVYVNYANAHGSLPTDVGDIVRDLPYLIRDLVRRISESLSSRRSGYSAI